MTIKGELTPLRGWVPFNASLENGGRSSAEGC
jgi:hypothetical protein